MKKSVFASKDTLLTVDDLKDNHHVGWLHEGESKNKGYVTTIYDKGVKYLTVAADSHNDGEMVDAYHKPIHDNIVDAVKAAKGIQEMFVFTTRKELYQWLAE